ncbi:hypothetical protein ACTPEF_24615, partial [Clostridioides difficile]
FHYIEFPDRDMMEEIVKVHFDKVEEHLLEQVMTTFYWIRSLKGIFRLTLSNALNGIFPQYVFDIFLILNMFILYSP